MTIEGVATKVADRTKSISLVRDWILHSGIQNQNENKKLHGAFNAWHDITNNTYPYMYSEITGYGLSTLAHIAAEFGDNELIRQKITDAHVWLRDVALHESGGVRTRDYYPGSSAYNEHFDFKNETLYTFDTGMVLNGLMSAYNLTKDETLIETAKKNAEFLLKAQKEDGSIYAYWEARINKWVDTPEKWSSQSGAYHAKCAIGLYTLAFALHNESYKDAALKLCEYALTLQNDDGRFTSFRETTNTELHPHTYTIEGLLYIAHKEQNQTYLDACKKAIQWSLKLQRSKGGVCRSVHNEIANKNERVDVLAQTLRMSAALNQSEEQLEKLEKQLLTYQNEGFIYGFDNDGNELSHTNAWVSMFAIQALSYRKTQETGEKIDLTNLI